ncbi:MAG TPA: hypothetical protein VFS88_04585 [Micavibrio sp.]|nr:hypothetical protein [Micavibrio sp.]
MKQVRSAFDGVAKTVRMDAARYIDPRSGSEKIVRLPGAALEAGSAHYNEAEHKGHLHCLHCDAHVRPRPASETAISGSSLKGHAAAFAIVAGQRHDTACEFYTAPKKSAPGRSKVNEGKGYRVHINTQEYSELYTPRDGSYSRRGAITKINDPDLADREIYTVKSAADLVEFMTMKETSRVVDSVVIFGNCKPIPWQDFFVRYNRAEPKQKRFLDLIARLRAGGADAQIPVLMEMQIARPRKFHPHAENLWVLSRRIPYERGDNGKSHDIFPAARIDREAAIHDRGVSGAFGNGTHQLVLGLATLNHPEGGHYYINVIVSDADQVMTVNIENIMKRASAKAHIGQLPAPELSPK